MSLTSITPAQRATLSGALQNAGKATTDFTENSKALPADRAAEILPVVQKAVDSLVVAGLAAAPLPATSTVVASGQQLTGVAPTGTYTSKVTFTVAGGVITAIVLS